MRRLLFLLLVAPSGCGYGLFQTAHTTPPAHVAVTGGGSVAFNDLDRGKDAPPNGAGELSGRVGLSDHIDVGLGAYILPGPRLDAKMDLLEPEDRLAIAPRIGAAYGQSGDDKLIAAFAGGIASYDVTPAITPYLGVTYVDHWIYRPKPVADITLAPNETLARRSGVGDGLVELALGISMTTGNASFLLEGGLWVPAQDDPGDYFRFVTNEIVSGALRIGF